MSLVFYYAPMSSAVTVHWALEELGAAYEKVKIDIQARDQDKPAFLALNPNGKVPLLVDDGTAIFESAAIILHLGEKLGIDKKLFPPPGAARAEAFKWIVWTSVTLGEALSRHQHNSSARIPAERHNAKAADVAKADVEKLMGILDGALATRRWLVGEGFSLADLHASSWVDYLGRLGFAPERFPNLDGWRKRSTDRPAYRTAMSP